MSIRLKTVLLAFLISAISTTCQLHKQLAKVTAPEIAPEDSTEYELIVLEPGFDSWYLLKPGAELDRGLEYYRYWNNQYVQEWNNSSGISRHFGTPINYDPNENYPVEIEHKLYYYFLYVEDVLKIPILKRSSRPDK
ncbi:MAG: DUF6146 family protein [Prolixibacteraceae bacterium]